MKKLLHYASNIAGVIIAFCLYAVLQVFYFSPQMAKDIFQLNKQEQVIVTAVITVFVFWLIFWLYKKQLKEFNDWGFNQEPHWDGRRIMIAVLGFVLSIIVQIVIINIIGTKGSSVSNNQQLLDKIMKQDGGLFEIMVVVIAPFCEEVIFRGMFFNIFFTKKNKLNKWLGIIVSGFLFAYLHDPGLTKFIFIYWAMGCVLGWIYLRTKDLRYSMLAHIGNNLISLL